MKDCFVPGRRPPLAGGLSAYRQPIPLEVARFYVENFSSPDDLVFAPFVQSDSILCTALDLQRRFLGTHINPLFTLLARVEAMPAPTSVIYSLSNAVANSSHYTITLRQHLLELYRSRCPRCQAEIPVDYFIWDRDERRPVAKSLHCQSCGEAGRFPVEDEDIELAAGYTYKGLMYYRALHRLASRGEELYERVQPLLDLLYTGRNLYALLHLTTRLLQPHILTENPFTQDTAAVLLLDCLDRCSSLDSPSRERRLMRLGVPTRFIERNVWHTFEWACERARERFTKSAGRPVPVCSTELSDSHAACRLVTAGLPQVAHVISVGSCPLIIMSPPSPWPAGWVLSFLWAAWIFGREKAAPLAHWLKRHTVDWEWYIAAMQGSFETLRQFLSLDGHIIMAFLSHSERWIEALLIAAARAGLTLDGASCQPAVDSSGAPSAEYRIVLSKTISHKTLSRAYIAAHDAMASAQQIARQAVRTLLHQRAEPSPGPLVHMTVYQALMADGLLSAKIMTPEGQNVLTSLGSTLWSDRPAGEKLTPIPIRNSLSEYPEHPTIQPVSWWIEDMQIPVGLTLLDRLEHAIAEELSQARELELWNFYQRIYHLFPGPLTPTQEAIDICIASYASVDPLGKLSLRPEDEPDRRAESLHVIRQDLLTLGEKLGLQVRDCRNDRQFMEGAHPPLSLPLDILWYPPADRPILLRIIRSTRSDQLKIDTEGIGPPSRCFLVLPGGRAPLVSFRLRCDPLWHDLVDVHGWQFIKFRHVRTLLSEARAHGIDWSGLLSIIGLDPIVERPDAQMRLL